MEHRNLLENIYLFKGLSHEELDKINEVCELRSHPPDDLIFAEGDDPTAFYLIKYGSVRISQRGDTSGDSVTIATLGTGSHFGEMTIIDREKRSASATTTEKSEIIVLDYEKLDKLLEQNKDIALHFFKELSEFLIRRLRVTTHDLNFAREKNIHHF